MAHNIIPFPNPVYKPVFLSRGLVAPALIYVFLLYGSWIFGVAGSPTPIKSPSRILAPRDNSGNQDAAHDIYGLGVRVGFYLQGFAQLLHIVPRRKDSGRGVKLACASIAISILASWSVLARTRLFSPCEAYLVTFILNSVNLPAAMTVINPDAIVGEGIGLLLFLVSLVWTNVASTWTYATLYRTLPRLDTENVVYFFAAVSVTGGFRIFMLLVSLLNWLVILAEAPYFLGIGWCALRCYLKGLDELPEEIREKLKRSEKGFMRKAHEKLMNKAREKLMNAIFKSRARRRRTEDFEFVFPVSRLIASFLAWGIFIIMAEKTILLNHLSPETDLTLPGQLIPLITGIAIVVDSVLFLCRPLGGKSAVEQYKDFDFQLKFLISVRESLTEHPPTVWPLPLAFGVEEMFKDLRMSPRFESIDKKIHDDYETLQRVLHRDYEILLHHYPRNRFHKAWKIFTWNPDKVRGYLGRMESSIEELQELLVGMPQKLYIQNLKAYIWNMEIRLKRDAEAHELDLREIYSWRDRVAASIEELKTWIADESQERRVKDLQTYVWEAGGLIGALHRVLENRARAPDSFRHVKGRANSL